MPRKLSFVWMIWSALWQTYSWTSGTATKNARTHVIGYNMDTGYMHCTSLLCQSLAVSHVITSDPLRYQPYWCRRCVVWLLETGHSRWLPHRHGMPYHDSFRTHPLFPFSAENWRPFCSGRRSLMWSDNELCFIYTPVAKCCYVTMYWLLQTDSVNTVAAMR